MKAKLLLVRCSCAGALTLIVTSAMADASARNALPVKVTPLMIRQASAAATISETLQPTKDQSYVLGKDAQANEIFRHPQNLDQLPNGCAKKGGSLCYDYRSGHTVYKPMRKLLPDIPGMTPHNLSLRRDKIVAHYTFK